MPTYTVLDRFDEKPGSCSLIGKNNKNDKVTRETRCIELAVQLYPPLRY